MDTKRQLLRHFLAALAYRTQKALRGAPESFADFEPGQGVRTPHEILRHMTGVLLYALSFLETVDSRPEKCPTLADEAQRFHQTLERLGKHLDEGTPFGERTPERVLQGPFADAMTHAGQLTMLRRLAGSPVQGENFVKAAIDPQNLSSDQPDPVSPDGE